MYSNDNFIIDLLQENEIIDQDMLEKASQHRRSSETTLETLMRMGQVDDSKVAQVMAESNGMDFVDLGQYEINESVLSEDVVNPGDCARYQMVPINFDGTNLVIAVADPMNMETLDSLQHVLPYPPEFVCARVSQIRQLVMDRFAGQLTESERIALGGGDEVAVPAALGETDASEEDAPIIGMVHQILSDAFQNRASDIHIEPLEKEIRVRYRIDGALHHTASHPRKLLPAVISRIKIMTGTMSIAEKRVPQDGRIQANMGKNEIDLRVSTIPTNHGESVVMRILDKSSLLLGLPQLGFYSDDQENFNKLIRLPDGILLVTGPTGSGKTTTLYACLNEINKPDRKIITVEDPVEYQLAGINQVMVKDDIGMTFHAALRSILRQAPNIIMIG
ncbi:MAG: GspE/PulE family protein, partial [Verrucomicrobiota bacterium]